MATKMPFWKCFRLAKNWSQEWQAPVQMNRSFRVNQLVCSPFLCLHVPSRKESAMWNELTQSCISCPMTPTIGHWLNFLSKSLVHRRDLFCEERCQTHLSVPYYPLQDKRSLVSIVLALLGVFPSQHCVLLFQLHMHCNEKSILVDQIRPFLFTCFAAGNKLEWKWELCPFRCKEASSFAVHMQWDCPGQIKAVVPSRLKCFTPLW